MNASCRSGAIRLSGFGSARQPPGYGVGGRWNWLRWFAFVVAEIHRRYRVARHRVDGWGVASVLSAGSMLCPAQ